MAHMTQIGAPLAVAVALGAACGSSEDTRQVGAESGAADSAAVAGTGPSRPRVSNVMIGRQIGTGNRITEPTFEFGPRDTVHLSVAIEGGGEPGRLTAAWRSQGGEIMQQTAELVATGGGNTAFNLSEPKGLKPGTYKVIVFLGDDSVDTKVFVVRRQPNE
ncbi:MAG TPA: hypothetical protein VMN37_04875 [Gemmatimonadales bacterium]|nr:hypothetical protein [Gemmatimonadales bacterium]